MTIPDWPGRPALAQAAQRAWWRRLWLIGVLMAVALAVIAGTGAFETERPTGGFSWADAAFSVVGVALGGGIVMLVLAATTRNGKAGFVPIILGLPFRVRRQVMRDLRRGMPSTDPTLGHVEREIAQRWVRQGQWAPAVYAVAIALCVWEFFFRDGPIASRVLYGVFGLLLVGMLVYALWYGHRIRHYLAVR